MDTANNALRKAEENQSTIQSLTSKVEHLSDAVEFLLSENKKQKDNKPNISWLLCKEE